MKTSTCCGEDVYYYDGCYICKECQQDCQFEDDEEEKSFKSYGLTSRQRAGMSREANGDFFVDD